MSEKPEKPMGVPEWTLGDRLRKSIEHAGVGVGEMAEYLEVDRNTVSNYIHDKVRVPGAVIRLWAIRTGVPLEWLRTGSSPFGPNGGGTSKTALRDLTEAKRNRATRNTRGYFEAPIAA